MSEMKEYSCSNSQMIDLYRKLKEICKISTKTDKYV